MITENLIDRLNVQAAQRLVSKVRNGRRRALSSISRCCVVMTDDGRETREVIFDQPPTIGQLEAQNLEMPVSGRYLGGLSLISRHIGPRGDGEHRENRKKTGDPKTARFVVSEFR